MNFDVKQKVRDYYGGIASQVKSTSSSGCGCNASCCGDVSNSSLIYNSEQLKNLPKEAVAASLGCADPVIFADIKEGETVLDLGSGGGIDVLVASRYVGATGKVYGLDMTDEMLELANQNKTKMGATNVEFIKGFIEEIPLNNEAVDCILSNCVINLSEDKERALTEAHRVLKAGGRLAIADIVNLTDVPDHVRKSAELWAGCIAGTLKVGEYKEILEKVGFTNVEIEPVHVYTKSVIESLANQKDTNLADILAQTDIEILDGAFAGAYIKAYK
ncbi:SAM-dependent methyltransferase [Anaerosolibacter carboniphilus]|uniref:Arsenite methyltransferase n=1 Tax=Anaerosolibacter carboniphilus TaxID=1417629 RepID=A0A841KNP5_9FIRM|nr:arsenite methyltransferase [Anaerosolibacter carboniphilus]MBB6215047.1 SAM-dependent methyltransferase [Anaerosolibacter carboniphilus]